MTAGPSPGVAFDVSGWPAGEWLLFARSGRLEST